MQIQPFLKVEKIYQLLFYQLFRIIFHFCERSLPLRSNQLVQQPSEGNGTPPHSRLNGRLLRQVNQVGALKRPADWTIIPRTFLRHIRVQSLAQVKARILNGSP